MKRHAPTLFLVAGALWVLVGILDFIRGDYSQAGLDFSVGTVFTALGSSSKHSTKGV